MTNLQGYLARLASSRSRGIELLAKPGRIGDSVAIFAWGFYFGFITGALLLALIMPVIDGLSKF